MIKKVKMKKVFVGIVCFFAITNLYAQATLDTTKVGDNIIIKDSRITVLEDKLLELNTAAAKAVKSNTVATSSSGIVLGKGYRLMVISTTDRELAMKVRAQLYQIFPDQKQYMSFQMPNTKIRMGNYVDRGEADRVKKKIMQMKLVSNNVYIMPETIEIKVEKKDPNAEDGDDKAAKDGKKVVKKKKAKTGN